jgi:predicted benzoate:H+ symporter BenE
MSTAFIEALIDYCLLIVFFIGVIVAILFLSWHTRQVALEPAEKQFEEHKPQGAAYAMLGGLLLLFCVLAFSASGGKKEHV